MKTIGLIIGLVAFIAFVVLSNGWIMREIKDVSRIKEQDLPAQTQVRTVTKDTQNPLPSTSPPVETNVLKGQGKYPLGHEEADKMDKEVIYEFPMNDVILVQ